MIKNQLQYSVSQSQAQRFERALDDARGKDIPDNTHPRMWQAYIEGLESQLETIRRDLAEYESLKRNKFAPIMIKNLSDLPKALIKARIMKGMTQKELAECLGVRQQQVQRWESNDYENVGFSNLIEVAEALDLDVSMLIVDRQLLSNVHTNVVTTGSKRPLAVTNIIAPQPVLTSNPSVVVFVPANAPAEDYSRMKLAGGI